MASTERRFVKRKRNVMTLETKIQLLDCLAAGETYASVSKKFKVNESTVRTIKKVSKQFGLVFRVVLVPAVK